MRIPAIHLFAGAVLLVLTTAIAAAQTAPGAGGGDRGGSRGGDRGDGGSSLFEPGAGFVAKPNQTRACGKCIAFCQYITFMKSTYHHEDLGGGMSASACVDAAESYCSGAYNGMLLKAWCKNN